MLGLLDDLREAERYPIPTTENSSTNASKIDKTLSVTTLPFGCTPQTFLEEIGLHS